MYSDVINPEETVRVGWEKGILDRGIFEKPSHSPIRVRWELSVVL